MAYSARQVVYRPKFIDHCILKMQVKTESDLNVSEEKGLAYIQPCAAEVGKVMLESDITKLLRTTHREIIDFDILCDILNTYKIRFSEMQCSLTLGVGRVKWRGKTISIFKKGKIKIRETCTPKPRIIQEIPIEEMKRKKVLVITSCTAEKLGNTPKVKAKAKEMYKGRMFKLVRKLCETFGWDYVIISAKYGLVSPDEEIEGYEKFLKTKHDQKEIMPKVIPKLSKIISNYDKILVIAGQKYRKIIEDLMDERFFVLQSKGYGDLCSKIKRSILKTNYTLLNYINY